MRFEIGGVTFRPGTAADVVVASMASKFRFGDDAVLSSRRETLYEINPFGLWIGEFLGQIVIILNFHALARPVSEIWNGGRLLEGDKIADDMSLGPVAPPAVTLSIANSSNSAMR